MVYFSARRALALAGFLIPTLAFPSARAAVSAHPLCLKAGCYALGEATELLRLRADLEKKLQLSEDGEPDYPELKKKKRDQIIAAELTLIGGALDALAVGASALHPPEFFTQTLREVHRSLRLRLATPYPDGVDFVMLPVNIVRDYFPSPFIRGSRQATAAPQAATLREERAIESADLRVGKKSILPAGIDPEDSHCVYDSKKDSNGVQPGFAVKCGETKVKFKFREVHTEPFNSRIFWALGYHVDPVDYIARISVDYDPRIFSEFNARPGLDVQTELAGIPLFSVNIKPKNQPFDFIDYAVKKDGTRLSNEDLRSLLRKKEGAAGVDRLVFKEVQLQLDDPNIVKVGPWSYNDFNHPYDESIRGLAVLMAWISHADARRDNNRFVLDLNEPTPQWKFIVSDLGSGLGRAVSRYTVFNSFENLDHFRRRIAGPHGLGRYQLHEKNHAFPKTTKAEAARVLARMNRLTEDQLRDALVASGFPESTRNGYLHELLRRRRELNLAFPPEGVRARDDD